MDMFTMVTFGLGFVVLIAGAELLVRGASKLAVAVGISPLVVGLTVVAFGTSSPELAVSVQSNLRGASDVALGNVVGSNIVNVLFILGVSAVIAPLVVAQQLIRLDVPLMIGLSVLVLLLGFDGTIGRLDGALLFGGVVAYTVFAIRQSRKETQAVRAVYEQQFASGPNRLNMKQTALQVVLIVVGLALLVQGANWLVNGAVTLARLFRVSELVIGLTIVAVGTSLPEIATSILATIRGERDIAVGNVVGSNIFNILAVLGISALVAPAGLAVSPAALRFDIPVMIAVAVVCLPIFFTGGLIARWEGLLFVGYYAAYTLFLIISAGAPQSMISFERVMIWAALPLTILVLLGSVGRSLWAARSGVVLESSPETLSDSHLSGQ